MSVEKLNGKWYIRGKIKKDNGGYYEYRRIARGCTGKKEAQEYERLFRKKYQDVIVSKEHRSLKEVADCMLAESTSNGVKESTIRTNRYNLSKVPESVLNKKINLITHEHLQKVIRNLESDGFSENYISAIYYLLRKLFNFAIFKGYISVNPMDRVKMRVNSEKVKKEINFWESEQFDAFIDFASENGMDPDMVAFLCFSYDMGTRKGETLAIQWGDVDLIRGTVSIKKTVTKSGGHQKWKVTSPKSKNSTRVLTMPKRTAELIGNLYDRQKEMVGFGADAFLFGFYRPWPMDKPRRHFQKAISEYNATHDDQLPMLRIHDLRHSHASYLINNMRDRYSVYDVAKRLGDTVDTVLDTYAHWFRDADRKLVESIDNQTGINERQTDFSQLIELKKLLDIGVITSADYDAKKRQVLGI